MSEAKRLSPGQLNEALAMVSADGGLRDDLAGHIAALEAEIARLRPSGQVAEDVAFIADQRAQLYAATLMLTDAQREANDRVRHHGALPPDIARLAAKAQGYEAFAAACREALGPH